MKKSTTKIVAVAGLMLATALGGCVEVDNSYDLSDISTDGIVIGDEFIAPVGTVTTSPAELLGLLSSLTPQTRTTQSIDIPEEFSKEYAINARLDEDLIETLSNDGELSIKIVIDNTSSPLSFNAHIKFLDNRHELICDPFGNLVFKANDTNEYAYEITPATLNLIADASYVGIFAERTCISPLTLDSEAPITIKLQVVKKGGISLKDKS